MKILMSKNPRIKWELNRVGFVIDDMTVFFVVLSYLSTIAHHHNYLSMRNTIRTLVAEEMYYAFIFIYAKQC